jgi:hypothetical protein
MTPIRIKRRPRTLGDLISTAVFLGMAGWFGGEAIIAADVGPLWKAVGLGICAVMCLVASLRHVIVRVWIMLFGDGDAR